MVDEVKKSLLERLRPYSFMDAGAPREAAEEIERLQKDAALLRAALIGLIGVESKQELQGMELAIRALPVPEADKAISINAIHALLATMPNA